ncbi:MAG: NTE family protein [Candidatus Saganbacteria bacterium]|uniref:NTE family protein n=1 Tax=Candidatus Saganbacteria bacterium TaxID=2575572 RepID=A0A833NYJ8_UNCSA|nr:MAG: NTE family protein [Candidatus Saganbacteria bacterium]
MALLDKIFRKKKIGLALSGGAAYGFAHIGVLKALKKNKIKIDYVAGVSAGAIVGAIFAAGMDPDIMEVNAKKVGWFRFLKFPLGKTGILSTEEIEKFIIENIGDKEIKDLNIPFAAVAVDLMSGKEVVIDKGKVARAAAISSAFPGIFSAVEIDNKLLVDGTVYNNLPTSVVKKMGADIVIAVDVIPANHLKKAPANQVQILERAYDILVKSSTEQSRKMANIVIEPEIPDDIWHFDVDEYPQLIKAGEEAARKKIAEIKTKVTFF